jgi:uncharacterized integral membrane protein
MQFLKTLFWIVLTILLVLFASRNWTIVPIHLWGGILIDVKLPFLILAAFLLGFLPPFFLYRARMWALRRRYETAQPQVVANLPGSVSNSDVPPRSEEERLATDSKVWPA